MSGEIVAMIAKNSKKKKKKLSTIKKKILEERFQYFQSQLSSEEYETLFPSTEKLSQIKTKDNESVSLVFNNLLNLSDCDDIDEMEEIYDNLLDVLKPFIKSKGKSKNKNKTNNNIENIDTIKIIQIDPSKEILIEEKENKGNLDRYLDKNSNYIPLMVRFDSSIQPSAYNSIVSSLNGIVMGGMNLSVTTNIMSKLENNDDKEEATDTNNTNADVMKIYGPPDIDSILKNEDKNKDRWILVTRGTIEDENLEDESEAFEILFDLMNLSQHHGCSPNALWIESDITKEFTSTNVIMKVSSNKTQIQLGIEFSNFDYGWKISQSLTDKQFQVFLCDQQGRTRHLHNEENEKQGFHLAVQIFDFVEADMDIDEMDECINDLCSIINGKCSNNSSMMKMLLIDKKHLLIFMTNFNISCDIYKLLNETKFGGKILELELIGVHYLPKENEEDDELSSATQISSNDITSKVVYTNNKDLNTKFSILVNTSASTEVDLNALKKKFMGVYKSLSVDIESENDSGYIVRCFSPLNMNINNDYSDSTVVKFLYSNYQDAITMLLYLDGCVLGGTTVHCHLQRLHLTNSDPELDSIKAEMSTSRFSIAINHKINENESTEEPKNKRPKIPHLPKMIQGQTNNEEETDLLSRLPYATEEMALVVKEMLRDLARFQLNAFQRDPVRAKAKARYVIGLKQAINGVKSGRARLVILATDCEISAALASKFNTLVRECAKKDDPIPILYALKRRALGKALNTDTKVSAMAIYDPDGAYPAFKKIMRTLETD